MQRQIRWMATNEVGLEQLNLTIDQNGILAKGVVIGGDREDNATWALTYEVACDLAWRTRQVKVTNHDTGKRLELFSDGNGFWTDSSGQLLKEFTGCLDVDIRATPFTNTLPLRRLDLKPGNSAEIRVVYIPMPGLMPAPIEQHYTALASDRYRYESATRDFVAELTTDSDRLVVEYPGLFRRAL